MSSRRVVYVALAGAVVIAIVAGARQQARSIDYGSRQASGVRYLKVSNPGEDDRIGIGDPLVGVTLAMSADGSTLAVSTPHEDSRSGIDGDQSDNSVRDSGAVYVYQAS